MSGDCDDAEVGCRGLTARPFHHTHHKVFFFCFVCLFVFGFFCIVSSFVRSSLRLLLGDGNFNSRLISQHLRWLVSVLRVEEESNYVCLRSVGALLADPWSAAAGSSVI